MKETDKLEEITTINYGYWTIERCAKSASRFGTLSEWRREEPDAYNAARRHGWIDDLLPINDTRLPNGYWTLDRCLESASEFESKNKWRKTYSSAYNAALKNKWMDICWPNFDNDDITYVDKKPSGYWTLERCKESAKKFKTHDAWRKGQSGAYDAASRNGWLSVCHPDNESENENSRKPRGYWTRKRCIESASMFETRKKWRESCGGSYTVASKNGWLTKCLHRENPNNPSKKWTLKLCLESAKRFRTKGEWMNADKPAYNAAKSNWQWWSRCGSEIKSNFFRTKLTTNSRVE